VIVLTAIQGIGTYQAFLVAVVLSGLLQLIFGMLKLGVIADYVPNSVIKGTRGYRHSDSSRLRRSA
jgi:MFS superfamily sulfate permease-like transporter